MRTSNWPGTGCRETTGQSYRKLRPLSGFQLGQCFTLQPLMYYTCSRVRIVFRLGGADACFLSMVTICVCVVQ